MLPWAARPSEEAAHFNPAFCGELVARAIDGYRRTAGMSLPLPLAYLVLPLTLYPAARSSLPRRSDTAFASWAGENAAVLAGVPERAVALRSVTREAILYIAQLGAVTVGPRGLEPGPLAFPLFAARAATTPETTQILRSAALVGRWFGMQASAEAVMLTMGVRV